MANYRRNRINDAVAQELSVALRNVRDPRITADLVSVTRAEVAPDLRNATVYFSCMGDPREVRTALIKCTGLLRHHLAETVNLRLTPQLVFVHDDSIAHGARIAQLLDEIKTDETDGEKPHESADD